jgi:hypothetical protein
MQIARASIVDISLELDARNFGMRTPVGFTKDLQFAMEVLKEHDAPGGAGQIVRGVHMRLHAGSHVDAPEHNVRGGTQIHQVRYIPRSGGRADIVGRVTRLSMRTTRARTRKSPRSFCHCDRRRHNPRSTACTTWWGNVSVKVA